MYNAVQTPGAPQQAQPDGRPRPRGTALASATLQLCMSARAHEVLQSAPALAEEWQRAMCAENVLASVPALARLNGRLAMDRRIGALHIPQLDRYGCARLRCCGLARTGNPVHVSYGAELRAAAAPVHVMAAAEADELGLARATPPQHVYHCCVLLSMLSAAPAHSLPYLSPALFDAPAPPTTPCARIPAPCFCRLGHAELLVKCYFQLGRVSYTVHS